MPGQMHRHGFEGLFAEIMLTRAGQLRLFVSNNDRTVKVFDLPSMRLMSTISCPVAVNYAALSPDGNYLACVGDSGATHIYRAAPTGLIQPINMRTSF